MIRSRPIGTLAAGLAVSVAALAVAGCGGGSSSNATASNVPPATASGHAATVSLANEGSLGKILVNSKGRTLYLFQKDTATKSKCTGACASAWPPLRASGKPVVGAGLSASKLGTTPRSDGKPEVTYNGHPLYLFSGDSKPGDTNGQGTNAFGASWFALTSAGNTVSGGGTSSGGAGGY
jgi:predicted lipoprotein with Yx(FWY)xxD motif